MKVRLERKFAELIDDVNLSKHRVGDVIDLPWHDASMLLAEGWASPAEPMDPTPHVNDLGSFFPRRLA
jgi:hypothetical protein